MQAISALSAADFHRLMQKRADNLLTVLCSQLPRTIINVARMYERDWRYSARSLWIGARQSIAGSRPSNRVAL